MTSPFMDEEQAVAYLHTTSKRLKAWMNGGLLRPDGRAGPRGSWLFRPATLDAFARQSAGKRVNPNTIEEEATCPAEDDEKGHASPARTTGRTDAGSYLSGLREWMEELQPKRSTSTPSPTP